MYRAFALFLLTSASCLLAQENHAHPVPEKLGEVSFPISCDAAVQVEFNRGVALLHSFTYGPAEQSFQIVARRDPKCAMAHWGIAMTHFRQLWQPPILPLETSIGQNEIEQARSIGGGNKRERELIDALALIFENADTIPYPTRAAKYEKAMSDVAGTNLGDLEVQVFYALALLANASPTDKTHAKQKQAIDLLEPFYRSHPQHPGIPHYLIHASDNAELAPRGLEPAREYSKIAPSAPHALHMPSHIFTRLGLWDDSIASNQAARYAARQQGDIGEELHAMDYLVYAYLQTGRYENAAEVIQQSKVVSKSGTREFKVTYASTVMPIRYAVERGQWEEAANVVPPAGAPPEVIAAAVWSRGLGLARSGRAAEARTEVTKLKQIEAQLRGSGNEYWATQVNILTLEVTAWCAQQDGASEQALLLLRQAADEEDGIEKLPATPGPILPAREQLAALLLEQNQPDAALREFQTALLNAPGRRGALEGASLAAKQTRHKSQANLRTDWE